MSTVSVVGILTVNIVKNDICSAFTKKPKSTKIYKATAIVDPKGVDPSGTLQSEFTHLKRFEVGSPSRLDAKVSEWVSKIIVPSELNPEFFVELQNPPGLKGVVFFVKAHEDTSKHNKVYEIWYEVKRG